MFIKKYINSSSNMEWECEYKEHLSWFSTYNNVVNRGTWCSKCRDIRSNEKQKSKIGLERAQKYASSKGGECLSTEYINSKKNLQWKCHDLKHLSWNAPFDRVVGSKRWCPECAKNQQLPGIELAKEYAKSKNGECLSTQYINTKTKLQWKCENEKHLSWFSSFEHAVTRNQWCPHCYKENITKN